MPVGHFHHIVLEVSDLGRSERFYAEEGLGLDPLGRDIWPEDHSNAAFKTSEGQYVVLVEVPEIRPDGPGVHTNFILSPEDYPMVFERLQALDCLVIDHRDEQRAGGEVSTYFNDPDGHRLQITAYAPDAFLVRPAKRGKIVAGRLDDFPVGSVTHNREGKFYVVRLEEGILAINEVCTHMNCSVGYQAEHYRFYCACHYNRFSRKGEHLGHLAGTQPLHVYSIEFVDGEIVVDTDRTIPRTPDDADRMVLIPEVAR